MEIQTVKPEVVQQKKVMMIGVVPNSNEFYVGAAWDTIRPYAQQIIAKVMKEYEEHDLWRSIYYGKVHLCMAFELPWDKAEPPTSKEMQNEVIKCLASDEKDKCFVAYAIVQTDTGNAAHRWHVFILPKYANTNVSALGDEWLTQQAKKMGFRYETAAVYEPAMEVLLSKLGFTRVCSVWRREIKEK